MSSELGTTIPIPPLTEDQKEYLECIHKAGKVEPDDPRLQEPIGPGTTHDWVVSVRLGDVDGITADEWMEAIMEFVYTRDNGFSGAVVMQKGHPSMPPPEITDPTRP